MKEAILCVVALGLVIAGVVCGMDIASGNWQRDLIKRDLAEYNSKTAAWQYKPIQTGTFYTNITYKYFVTEYHGLPPLTETKFFTSEITSDGTNIIVEYGTNHYWNRGPMKIH